VILFDLDDFKTINDTYGHDAGDTVLKTVTKIIQQLLREHDLFGRVGGEEFLILLPSTDQVSALEIAERIRAEVAKTDIVVASASLKSSISLGVSSNHSEHTLSQLVSLADKALYEAKRSGKNKAVSA
jgi:diguanylate cyclase (GGDEF)-like protein